MERPFAQTRRRPRPRHARRPRRVRAGRERGRSRRSQGGDRRRSHARSDRRVSHRRRPGLRRGHQVHLERRQGLQPERDLGEGAGGRQGRVDPHLLRPRERLAQPVHLRPQVRHQGRVRAQRDGRRRRLQQQVLRRALRLDPRPRAERGHHPGPPLLRLGQLRAGQRRPVRHRGPPARRQLRRRLPQGQRPRGHRRRPRQPRAVHPGALHDAHDHRGRVAQRPGLPRPREVVRLDPDAGRHRLHRHRQHDGRLLPLAGRQAGPHHRRRHRRARRPTPAAIRASSSSRATPRPAPPGRRSSRARA